MQSTSDSVAAGYNGLTEHTQGLPADAYFDPGQYERELQRIWYRNWVYVGRSSDVARARTFRTFELGDQKLLLVRDDHGVLQGFHNTCRHRGAALCRETEGVLRTATVVSANESKGFLKETVKDCARRRRFEPILFASLKSTDLVFQISF